MLKGSESHPEWLSATRLHGLVLAKGPRKPLIYSEARQGELLGFNLPNRTAVRIPLNVGKSYFSGGQQVLKIDKDIKAQNTFSSEYFARLKNS